jgi:hypothetical protein
MGRHDPKPCPRRFGNPPPKTTAQDAPRSTIVTPDDPQHGVIDGPHGIFGNRSIALVNSVASLQ